MNDANTDVDRSVDVSRRRLVGAVSGAVVTAIAGCSGDDGGDTDTPTDTDTPADTGSGNGNGNGNGNGMGTTEADTETETGTATPTATATPTPTATPSAWTQLFNGEDIDDWTRNFAGKDPGEPHKDVFVVEDGLLKATYDGYGEWDGTFGHLFYDGEFSHYALRAEYRFGDGQPSGAPRWAARNNGLMLHGQAPGEMDVGQDYPDSIEMQLLGQHPGGGQRTTANLCTPGTQVVMDGELTTEHCTDSSSDTYPADEWVTVTAVVRGNEEVRHYVEGTQVMEYTEPQLDDGTLLDSGTISIQAESHPTQFRTIELLEIDPDAPLGEGFVPPAPASVSVDWGLPEEIRVTSEETTTVTTEVANEDERSIFDGEISLEASSPDITVSADGNTTFDSLASGDTQMTEWTVTLPGELASGDYTLQGVVAYTGGGTTAEATGSLSFTVV
jgi:hypothetical protein